MRRIFLWLNMVLTSIVVVGIFVQAYLITAYITGTSGSQDALDAHRFLGFSIIHPLELLVFLTAFGAWPKAWKWIGFTFLLPLIGTIQLFLAPPETGDRQSGWVHGLHGLLALVVLVMAAIIAHRGMRELGLRQARHGGADADMPRSRP
ncbi:MAG: hypothetical protein H0W14_03690 [Actinobacteria bacterium]|nr:hypothetical protein [Actinomycetota bacterium]